jgi:predicted GH43/DUF377 family glycosyl hydrolase
MKNNGLSLMLILIITACASPQPEVTQTSLPATIEPTATAFPSATPTPEKIQVFNLISDDPIVPHGESSDWDSRYTDPGAVIYHDGMFYMFRNGFRDFPAESQVGLVTSPDGYIWTEQGDEPIFKTSDVAYAKIAMYASSALVMEDDSWVIYFYTWDSSSFPGSSVIGRATASSPAGPWVADPEPVLNLGAEGEWDAQQVLAPHVIQTTTGYVMYYSGVNTSGAQRIGMATSTNGVQWTKYNDPSTTEAPYAESDPVFQPGEKGQWDAGWVHQPRVFQTADGWVMIYRGTQNVKGEKMALGLATSPDGIHWARSALNPVFTPRDIPKAAYIWFDNVLLVNDTYYLFVEGDVNQSTQIYLAITEGEITP